MAPQTGGLRSQRGFGWTGGPASDVPVVRDRSPEQGGLFRLLWMEVQPEKTEEVVDSGISGT